MVSFLFKWLVVSSVVLLLPDNHVHPIFVSVTEIEHNAKDKTLEISCKIFTDDFEKTLRQAYHTHIDLLAEKDKPAMQKLVNDYIQKHFSIKADGKPVTMHYLGYQQEEEGIVSFLQVNSIATVKKLEIQYDILYEYKKEQISILHVNVNGQRKSTKLVNPENNAVIEF